MTDRYDMEAPTLRLALGYETNIALLVPLSRFRDNFESCNFLHYSESNLSRAKGARSVRYDYIPNIVLGVP